MHVLAVGIGTVIMFDLPMFLSALEEIAHILRENERYTVSFPPVAGQKRRRCTVI